MLYDLLISGKGIIGGGNLKKILLRHKTRLVAELVKLKVKYCFLVLMTVRPRWGGWFQCHIYAVLYGGVECSLHGEGTNFSLRRYLGRAKVQNNEDLLPEEVRNPLVLPRYLRVNPLKRDTANIIERLETELGKTAKKGECKASKDNTFEEEDSKEKLRDESSGTSTTGPSSKKRKATGQETTKAKRVRTSGKSQGQSEDLTEEEEQDEGEPKQRVRQDAHLPDVLVLPGLKDRRTNRLPMVLDGMLIQQDKVFPSMTTAQENQLKRFGTRRAASQHMPSHLLRVLMSSTAVRRQETRQGAPTGEKSWRMLAYPFTLKPLGSSNEEHGQNLRI